MQLEVKKEEEMEQVTNYDLILNEIEEVHQKLAKIESLWKNWRVIRPQLVEKQNLTCERQM